MERIAARIKHMAGYVVVLAKWLVLGALIGAVGGFVGSLFHIGVNYATSERLRYPWILYLLPLAGLVIVWLYKAAGVWGKGTNAVIESVHFGKAARTIRTTRGITDVDDGFPGQRLRDFARYGKPAEP
mgnify:CR=1 FL=1